VIYSQGQGRSQTFPTGQAVGAVSGTSSAVFRFQLVEDWQDSTISSALVFQTEGGSEGAFLEAATQVVDGGIKNMSVDLEIKLFGDGSGSRGVIGSTTNISSSTIVLATVKDVLKFEVGAQLQFAATKAGPARAMNTPGDALTVASVNRIAG